MMYIPLGNLMSVKNDAPTKPITKLTSQKTMKEIPNWNKYCSKNILTPSLDTVSYDAIGRVP